MDKYGLKISSDLEKDIIDFRRKFHEYPELSNDEYKTTEIIKDELIKLGIETVELENRPGVMGILKKDGFENKKTILIRADIDALPMEELSDNSFKSKVKGVMHSCGHDGHTASLLGVIKILKDNIELLDGNVKFLFQHSEELGTGAKEWVDLGILNNPKVDAVLGYHIMPISEGQIGIKNNEMCAASKVFEINIKGKGGHGAYPHKNINPINIAMEIIQKTQNLIINRFDTMDPLVINYCTINSGTKDNIVPETLRLSGTIRCLKDSIGNKAIELLRDKIEKIGLLNDANCKLNILAEIPAVTNDVLFNELIRKTTMEIYGENSVINLDNASMGSEDFGHLKRDGALGGYFYIGYSDSEGKYKETNHNPKFDFNEEILLKLSIVSAKTIINYLKGDI